MGNKYKILGFILLLFIGGISGYLLLRDPAKDFYGDWYGRDNYGVEYNFRIEKDYIYDLYYSDSVGMEYNIREDSKNKTLEVLQEELSKTVDDLDNTGTLMSNALFQMYTNGDLHMILIFNGTITTDIFLTQYDESQDKSETEEPSIRSSVYSETTSSSNVDKLSETTLSSSIESPERLNVSEKIDAFISSYTSIPPDWIMEEEDNGITIRATGFTATNEIEASSILSNILGISSTIASEVGKNVELRLLEQDNQNYSVVMVDGKIVTANEIYAQLK